MWNHTPPPHPLHPYPLCLVLPCGSFLVRPSPLDLKHWHRLCIQCTQTDSLQAQQPVKRSSGRAWAPYKNTLLGDKSIHVHFHPTSVFSSLPLVSPPTAELWRPTSITQSVFCCPPSSLDCHCSLFECQLLRFPSFYLKPLLFCRDERLVFLPSVCQTAAEPSSQPLFKCASRVFQCDACWLFRRRHRDLWPPQTSYLRETTFLKVHFAKNVHLFWFEFFIWAWKTQVLSQLKKKKGNKKKMQGRYSKNQISRNLGMLEKE